MDLLLRYGLVAVFVALLATAFGSPIPEDVGLLAAGLLAHHRPELLPWAYGVGWVGVCLADTVPWLLGHRVGLHPRGLLARFIGRRRSRRILAFYKRFGAWTIAICRMCPGMRFPAFFLAGATGMPLRRFWLIDGLAALITVGLWVTIGWRWGASITRALLWMERARVLGVALLAGVVAWLTWDLVRRWRRRRERLQAGEEVTEDLTGSHPV
ncbi:MAG: VTT domain-containing protein [Deltaproteobacteria bacterium]|nr:VTT domain-containing protein [Deltaproteobacteria bacterium]